MNKNSKGFTLIEILVVIGIIAVLATIVLIAINPARQFRQARDTQRTSNVNAILNAIGQYMVDTKGSLPAGIDSTAKVISSSGANICAALSPKYIPSLPVDPSVSTGPVTDCATSYDTKYSVVKDANGRITVSAVGEETPTIAVTR
jgi:prepilin-type N-terminal cleavage/methylation domain-containing protein